MEKLSRLKQPMELLHATTEFIRRAVKPAPTALPLSLLGHEDLFTGRSFLNF